MLKKAPVAVVVPARGNNSLGTIRSLGEKGVRCVALNTGVIAANCFSRYCVSFRVPDPAKHEEGFISTLISLKPKLGPTPVLFPMDDLCVMLFSKYRNVLQEYFRYSYLSWDVFEKCVNKRRMYSLAEKERIPIPRTLSPISMEEVHSIASKISFPSIIKPAGKFELHGDKAFHVFQFCRTYGSKAVRVESPEELIGKYHEALSRGIRCLIQEEIPGDATDLFTLAFYADRNSKILAGFVGRKMRQYPSDFGTVTVGQSVEGARVRELGAQFVRAARYEGIGNIEFKRDRRDGEFKLIEINARTGSFIYLPTASGINLPFVTYCDLLDIKKKWSAVQEENVFWIDIIRDLMLLREFRNSGRRISFHQWSRVWKAKHVHAIFSWRDPLPFLLLPFQCPRSEV